MLLEVLIFDMLYIYRPIQRVVDDVVLRKSLKKPA